MGITSVALEPLGTLLAKRINLVQLPRVRSVRWAATRRGLGAAAVAFERGGMGHPVSEWRSSRRSAADPA